MNIFSGYCTICDVVINFEYDDIILFVALLKINAWLCALIYFVNAANILFRRNINNWILFINYERMYCECLEANSLFAIKDCSKECYFGCRHSISTTGIVVWRTWLRLEPKLFKDHLWRRWIRPSDFKWISTTTGVVFLTSTNNY
jgi:hypothetical protein